MKRSPILQPLSREHHTALTLAKASERAALSDDEALVSQTCQRVIRAYANELEPHFQFEEVSLLPLLHSTETQPLVERTLADHQQLRGLLDALRQNDAGALDRFGKCLSAHVRFEERELFPVLESLL
jgi:hemerythrin-like domain-containing protein